MIEQDRRLAPRALFDGIENTDDRPETRDEFLSVVMIAYEQALEEGISPAGALAAILDWVSLELQRCVGRHDIVG
jgi:hypothetical protein